MASTPLATQPITSLGLSTANPLCCNSPVWQSVKANHVSVWILMCAQVLHASPLGPTPTATHQPPHQQPHHHQLAREPTFVHGELYQAASLDRCTHNLRPVGVQPQQLVDSLLVQTPGSARPAAASTAPRTPTAHLQWQPRPLRLPAVRQHPVHDGGRKANAHQRLQAPVPVRHVHHTREQAHVHHVRPH
jgi:hypothetical protein